MRPWDDLLPTYFEIGGKTYDIRSDYRAALDICAALNDIELTGQERAYIILDIFYSEFDEMPEECYQEAIDRCLEFISGPGPKNPGKTPKLVDWEQDFSMIIPEINRITGKEVRAVEYMHWWTFLGAYQAIGDCAWAQVVRIRDHIARGKKLDKQDKEWYNQNRYLVDFQHKYTESENDFMREWGGA